MTNKSLCLCYHGSIMSMTGEAVTGQATSLQSKEVMEPMFFRIVKCTLVHLPLSTLRSSPSGSSQSIILAAPARSLSIGRRLRMLELMLRLKRCGAQPINSRIRDRETSILCTSMGTSKIVKSNSGVHGHQFETFEVVTENSERGRVEKDSHRDNWRKDWSSKT